jgi:SSS family transporter
MPFRTRIRRAVVLLWIGVAVSALCGEADTGFTWDRLPELPRDLAGPFTGVAAAPDGTASVLVVAGGVSLPGSETGRGVWHDDIFVLEPGAGSWRTAGKLPHPAAFGLSVSVPQGLLCAGGEDGTRHLSDACILVWSEGRLSLRQLPALPRACAFMAGSRLGETVYITGGQGSPDSRDALRSFLRLDLSRPHTERAWEVLDPWPGPERLRAVAASQDGMLLLAGGIRPAPGNEGTGTAEYLTDAFGYVPGQRWRSLAPLPRPVAGAPAAAVGGTHVLVLGGEDGTNTARREVLAYETVTDTWRTLGALPQGVMATSAVTWRRQVSGSPVASIVIPGGADRPGRSVSAVFQTTPDRRQSPFHALDYLALVAYLLVLVWIGCSVARRGKTTEDFFLAGRRIPWWAATLSIFSTHLSAVTFMAIPAKAYASDWVSILMNVGIILVAPVTVFCFLPFFRRLNVTTIYEYLELRFGPGIRLYGSLSFVAYQLGRMGIYLLLPALALATVTGFDVYVCIAVMGLLCTLYTVLGGIEAVVWTDVLQSFVLVGGGILCIGVIIAREGFGLGGMLDVAASENKFHVFTMRGGLNSTVFWVVLTGGFFTQLVPFTSDQGLVQRFLTTPSERSAARAVWTHAIIVVPASLLFFGLGTALFVFYKARPELLQPAAESNDIILPWFVATQLPAGLAGLVIAGLFAATMSSVDSSMNSVATSLVTDFYRKVRPAASDAHRLAVARALTVAVGLLGTLSAVFVSNLDAKSLWDLILMFAGLLGSSLTGVFLLGAFTRRASARGTAAGVIASIAVLVAVRNMEPPPVHGYLYAAVGILTCVIVGYAASLALPGPRRSLEGLTLGTLRQEDQPS